MTVSRLELPRSKCASSAFAYRLGPAEGFSTAVALGRGSRGIGGDSTMVQAAFLFASRPNAQMKPQSSRATMVQATGEGLPRATIRA